MDAHNSHIPRPEAHPMQWGSLLPPVARATHALLLGIHGTLAAAGQSSKDGGAALAHCFLVTGDRGTGKTTVLLTAQLACHPSKDAHSTNGSAQLETPRVARDLLGRVHWLELLDVEPLQPGANFLTVLLIQIRNALDHARGSARSSHRVSLLEEDTNDARSRIDKLINDAALIWEEIHETTTRERAHRQVSAAESFARFRTDIKEALAAVGRALASHTSAEESVVLILPIDNIDRSTEHLKNIFKLAQLVACKNLIMVFASDRVELETFLERSYWKELVKDVPRGGRSEKRDEALAIARRQASSTIRKLLPPNNRLGIQPASAAEALCFTPAAGQDHERLSDLLATLPTLRPPRPEATTAARKWAPANLLELMLANPHHDETKNDQEKRRQRLQQRRVGQAEPFIPTAIGAAALTLPARSLLDLWILLQREQQRRERDDPSDQRYDPARVARSVVRLLVAESNLPQWAAEVLQDQVVRRKVDGSTQQVLQRSVDRPPYVQVRRLRSMSMSLQGARTPDGEVLDFLAVLLHEKHDFQVRIGSGQQGALDQDPEMPPCAAAWLMLLYDLLINDPDASVINAPDDFLDHVGPRVDAHWHGWDDQRSFQLLLAWPAPRWGTFFEHELMNQAWTRTIEDFERARSATESIDNEITLRWRRLLALAWVDLTLWMGEEEPSRWPRPDWDWSKVSTDAKAPIGGAPNRFAGSDAYIHDLAEEIFERAATRLRKIEGAAQWVYAPKTGDDISELSLYLWLAFRLPRFFTGELGTGLSYDAHCPRALKVLWEATDMTKKIVRRRRQSLERALRGALREKGETDEKALDERVARLLPKLLHDFDRDASTPFAAARP